MLYISHIIYRFMYIMYVQVNSKQTIHATRNNSQSSHLEIGKIVVD